MIAGASSPRAATVIATGATLVTAVVGLSLLGRADLAAPPITSVDGWRSWFDARDPAVAVFALVRLVALWIAWYLLVVLVLGLLARLFRWRSAARAVDAVTPPGLRRVTAALFGIGLVGVTAGPLAGEGGGAPTETLVVLDALAPAGPPESLVPLDDEAGVSGGEATLSMLPPDKRHRVEEPAPPPLETWIVRAGDHLWSIAEAHLTEVMGRPPTDAETAPYWRLLIEHNRSRLSHPDQPDLLFVGQSVELPDPGPSR
ncbi:MAG: LysM peptidoglycan-binding domain-containing protein [Acidimicrobiales bacterium]